MLQIILEIRKVLLFSKLNVLDFRKLFLNEFYKLYLIKRNVLNTNNVILNSRYSIWIRLIFFTVKPMGNRVKPTLFKVSSTLPAEMRIDRIPRIIRLLLYTLIHILKRVIFDQHTTLHYYILGLVSKIICINIKWWIYLKKTSQSFFTINKVFEVIEA